MVHGPYIFPSSPPSTNTSLEVEERPAVLPGGAIIPDQWDAPVEVGSLSHYWLVVEPTHPKN